MKYLFKRTLAMIIDSIMFAIYALLLFAFVSLILKLNLKLSEFAGNVVGFFLMIFPALIYFIYSDYKKSHQTIGKKIMKLTLISQSDSTITLMQSIIRNLIKLLPWQLGHMMVYHGFATDWQIDALMLAYICLIYGLLIINMCLMIFNKNHLVIHDFIATTKVVDV